MRLFLLLEIFDKLHFCLDLKKYSFRKQALSTVVTYIHLQLCEFGTRSIV